MERRGSGRGTLDGYDGRGAEPIDELEARALDGGRVLRLDRDLDAPAGLLVGREARVAADGDGGVSGDDGVEVGGDLALVVDGVDGGEKKRRGAKALAD